MAFLNISGILGKKIKEAKMTGLWDVFMLPPLLILSQHNGLYV